jgi:adenylate cyclase
VPAVAAPVAEPVASRGIPALGLLLAFALPLGFLALVIEHPSVDSRWENHAAHFWIVLAAASANAALGYAVSVAGRRRRDARLFLVSLAFIAAAGFLGLHALATPGVLIGKNAGFELATPVGLAVAGAFAAVSGLELGPRAAARVMRASTPLLVGLGALLAAWGAVSIAEAWPLSGPLAAEQLDGAQISLAAVGVVLYAAASAGYLRLYRRRRALVLLAVTLAFGLLAEAMLVIVWARNWRASWWEWHLLMLLGFAAIALSARREWHEERFSPLYLERTLAGARDVSILFADLQGYTSFAERTPSAEVAAMLSAYFERLVPMLEAAGGEVHQIIGDAVMVIFNKQDDQPDHAARAARAGLELQAVSGAVAEDRPDWPRFRVGVNSGEVHAGVIGAQRGHRKHGVVGDTVNLAARLEAQAPAGKVVVGGETARRLAAGALLERLPELYVKGKEAPVEAYVLHNL